MIQMLLFSAIGIVFLILLYFFALRAEPKAEGGAQALVEARDALTSLQTELLPSDLVERVFAHDDLDFVMSKSSHLVQQLFLRERKRIALSWIAQVRKQALSLKEFHSGKSRLYAELDARAELVLAVNFMSLFVLCRVLQAAFYFRGPYAARPIVRPAIAAAAKVCAVSERSLAFLTPRERALGDVATR
jgi:hypothetical protein